MCVTARHQAHIRSTLPTVKLLTQTTINMLLKQYSALVETQRGSQTGLVRYALNTSPKPQIRFQYFPQQVKICQICEPANEFNTTANASNRF